MDNYIKIANWKMQIVYMKDWEKTTEEIKELTWCIVQRKGIYQIINSNGWFLVEWETDEFDLGKQEFTRYNNLDKTYISSIKWKEDLEIKIGRKVNLNIVIYLKTENYWILKMFLKNSQYVWVEAIWDEIKVLYDNPKKWSLYTIKDWSKINITIDNYDIVWYNVTIPIWNIIWKCDTEIIEYEIRGKVDYKKIKSVEEEFNELFLDI